VGSFLKHDPTARKVSGVQCTVRCVLSYHLLWLPPLAPL